MDKKELRIIIKERKAAAGAALLEETGRSAVGSLLELIERQNPKTLLLFHSLPDEVCTHELPDILCAQGRNVLLPSVKGEELELRLYKASSADGEKLRSGAYGIQEACGEIFTDYALIDLAVIPGIAFTADGKRLGRGKGYYDRLLPQLDCMKVGLCYPFQILEDIPTEGHDASVDFVIY